MSAIDRYREIYGPSGMKTLKTIATATKREVVYDRMQRAFKIKDSEILYPRAVQIILNQQEYIFWRPKIIEKRSPSGNLLFQLEAPAPLKGLPDPSTLPITEKV